MLKRIYVLFAIMLIASPFVMGQVTTSSITGTVKTGEKDYLVGATITATHIPSGSVYTTISKKDGIFILPGLRVGGPYQVKIDFVGQKSVVYDNITLQLGEAYNINAVMGINEVELSSVVVSARAKKAATDKGGMSTVVNNRILTTLPTISRSITDFTKLTPQANGNNFGGRDGRYNNITIDGANLNNNFGLSTDPLPGAGNNPVSIDAIDEVSVSIAPFDVRQGNFTGANIAAITKSGTNTFHGTAYTYLQNEKLRGSKVAGVSASNPAFKSKIYGGSIGGPIIKNKLFFFVNGEYEQKPPAAGISYSPTGGSGNGNISSVTVADLQAVSDYLKNNFSYDPGVFDNFAAFQNKNHKVLAKLDWNISKKQKLSVKFSDFKGIQDFQPSQSGSIGGTYSGVTYGPKFSSSAMGFSSTLYQQQDIVRSGSVELNSNFTSKISNQFLATFTKIQSDKTHSGATFPFIDILKGNANYISVGNEPFNGNNNKVHNDVLTFTDNLSYFTGKHNLTAGVSYEYQKVGNMFMRGSQGYFLYNSLSDFLSNAAPLKYALTYSLIPGQDAVFSAQLKIGQLSAYAQDEINAKPNLKFTIGIRADKPVFPEQPLENPATSALTFKDIKGNSVNFTTGKWPKATTLLSPRVGFRWDVYSDKSLIIRGGTGIFTGRIPYVYLTNIPTNSGMYQYSTSVTGSATSGYLLNADPHAYNPFYNTGLPANLFPTTAGTVASQDIVFVDPKYKFPQVWRSNLAVDQSLGKGWKVTIEAMYNKDINATYMYDANVGTPTGTITTGSYTRPYFTTTASRKIYSTVNNAIVLASTNKGHTFVISTSLEKSFSKGFYGSLAYTYTFAQNLTENPGSQASSTYSGNATAGTLNDLQLSTTSFAVPHRIIATFSYRKEYLKHLATTISIFYQASSGGAYNYVYNGSITNQGYASATLMYVPTNANDATQIQFKNNVTLGGVTYTSAQQAAIFEAYISQDPYLSKHRGQVVERNGARYPFYNRLDLKFAQDLFQNIGKQRHTLQFTADVVNFLNLLDNHWGITKIATLSSHNPLKLESVTNGVPTFSINTYNGAPVTQSYVNNVSTSTTYAIQLGLRYSF